MTKIVARESPGRRSPPDLTSGESAREPTAPRMQNMRHHPRTAGRDDRLPVVPSLVPRLLVDFHKRPGMIPVAMMEVLSWGETLPRRHFEKLLVHLRAAV